MSDPPRRSSSGSMAAVVTIPPPATFDDLVREQRATRRLLDEVIASQLDRDRDLNRRLDAIMGLLGEALKRG